MSEKQWGIRAETLLFSQGLTRETMSTLETLNVFDHLAPHGRTLLMLAVAHPSVPADTYCLRRLSLQCDGAAVDRFGCDALLFAACGTELSPEKVRILHAAGSKGFRTWPDGRDALMTVACGNRASVSPELVEALVEAGCKIAGCNGLSLVGRGEKAHLFPDVMTEDDLVRYRGGVADWRTWRKLRKAG